MRVFYNKYDPLTGEIIGRQLVSSFEPPTGDDLTLDSGNKLIVRVKGDSPHTHYVVLGDPDAVQARPVSAMSIDKVAISADGVDEAIIIGIPVGSTASIVEDGEEESLVITDGTLEISTELPGTISVRIADVFPIADYTVEVVAT